MRHFATRATKARAFHDPRLCRMVNPATGQYLHLSGTGVAASLDEAWLGYRTQADTLRRKAIENGQIWPYRPVARTIGDRELSENNF